ncbi:hypothetical protein CYMTET_5312 [Cymbomonas tetramitiformis]|uniref:Uncharacterized protein n=1 Tax=Cymbomonas tetramitiformis TaxID=36881 RepID=A0AAE0LJH8_9CHLO|nr:hypothetical protein CYMTET_5312 [Cymbomonas tetramitiformis]
MKSFNRFQVKYDEIDICPNECCRYDGNNQFLDECPECDAPRYVSGKAISPARYLPKEIHVSPQDSADMQAHARHVPWEKSGNEGMEKMWGAYQTFLHGLPAARVAF